MILVFGGTTEGRKAVEVLEQAGAPFYYSTRGSEQTVEMVHGIRLMGAMDLQEMVAFCREHSIRLLIDAAHPFAEQLHRNIADVAMQADIPLLRYERIYPPRTPDIHWCRDYADAIRQLEAAGVQRLLALTGVQTIGKLKPYWQHHDCRFRILDRDSSRAIAARHDFPEDRLLTLDSSLGFGNDADAILTKESGLSGGFVGKVETAKAAGMEIFAIERPPLYPQTDKSSAKLHFVDGPHGLRRTVERLVPDFYPLRSGLTTGTCATAAAVAALCRLQSGQTPEEVAVRLPDGETLYIPVGYADGYAFCIKDAGDDPDITNGAEIRARVEPASEFHILGGEGVGRFTLPGFDFPPGEPAINRGPRQMLRENIKGNYAVTISVRDGDLLARRTFNPRLGIEGGISIIGVSGIVQPYSEEAFLESIRKCVEVACASGSSRIVLGSGAKSENALRRLYPDLPAQAFVQYGNFVGETLRMAAELQIRQATLGVMLGKAVKLAAGQMDTHSRRATFDRDFVRQLLTEAHCDGNLADRITLVRELWQLIPPSELPTFVRVVIHHCRSHCQPLLPHGELTIFLVDDEGNIHHPGDDS